MAESNNSLVALKHHLATSGVNGTSLALRKESLAKTKEENILLLDISGSMADVLQSGQRRVDILWNLVQQMRGKNIPFRICIFNESTEWCEPTECPQPYSSTNLGGALQFLANNCSGLHQVTLITDGLPDNPDYALSEAQKLGCPINVLYVGPDDQEYNSLYAKAFCANLALASQGKYASNSLNSEILQLTANNDLRLMLTEGQGKGQINL